VKIGVDPHKLSVTIEVGDDDAEVLGKGRYRTDRSHLPSLRGPGQPVRGLASIIISESSAP
jgi:hypothetical protein